jgi:hypothetical protein
MRTKAIAPLGAFVLLTTAVSAQQADSYLIRLRQEAAVIEAPGVIPVSFVPSAKERAIRLRTSLEAAHSWYEKQLHTRVPIVLAVLDTATRQRVSGSSNPLPSGTPGRKGPGLIIFPERMQGRQLAGADPDHAAGGVLQGEHIIFHEDGHILADSLGIRGNAFINELIPGIFMAAYIHAKRPDLQFVLEDRRSGKVPPSSRYTTLADFMYLYGNMEAANAIWFQWQFERLADFMVKDQDFPTLIGRLQKAFPAGQKQLTVQEVLARLEGIRGGFLAAAGTLAGPTTLPRISPSPCQEQTAEGRTFQLAVRNETSAQIGVSFPDGHNADLPANSWRSYRVKAGWVLKLSNGKCLSAGQEPSIAVLEDR